MGPLTKVLLWKNPHNWVHGQAVLWSTVAMNVVITFTPTDSVAYAFQFLSIRVRVLVCIFVCVLCVL